MSKKRLHLEKATKLRMKDWSKRKNRTNASRGLVAWRLFKGIIFIVCLSLFLYQSAKFLEVYSSYPTTTKIEFTYPGKFELPAVTFCNQNPLKRSKFCTEYQNLCESPANITEVCEVNPFLCKDNPSNLMIPKVGFLANDSSEEVIQAINAIFFQGNITKEFWEEWSWSIETYSEMKPVFVQDLYMFFSCYTENLLLNSTDEQKMISLRYREGAILQYDLNVQRSEEMLIQVDPTVLYSIHSPFVPVNLMYRGKRLKVGHNYKIYIRLAEEKLLPFPYDTDCTDYEDLWIKNNRQGPRSQEMCKELCWHEIYKTGKDLLLSFEMLEYPLKLCLDSECTLPPEDRKFIVHCRKRCKRSCRNLKYSTTVIETSPDSSKRRNRELDLQRDKIQVEIFWEERQVVVERHFALYESGNLFSYIGGLMGCWLGVSIWAFAGITENVYRRAIIWVKQIKSYLKESSLARQKVFTKHRNNVMNIKIV